MIHANKLHKIFHQRAVLKAGSEDQSHLKQSTEPEADTMSIFEKIVRKECRTLIRYIFHNAGGR